MNKTTNLTWRKQGDRFTSYEEYSGFTITKWSNTRIMLARAEIIGFFLSIEDAKACAELIFKSTKKFYEDKRDAENKQK